MAALQKQMLQQGKISVVEGIRNSQMRQLANTGAFRVEAIKSTTAVENYTKALQKQDVTFRNWRKNAELRTQVLKEQNRIQRMSTIGWTQDGNGRVSADMIIPRDTPARLGHFRKSMMEVIKGQTDFKTVLGETQMRLGLWNQAVQSGSRNMINWGKNTQWAGRQMMVGLTIPMAAFAAASATLAYKVDQEMTRVLKVYDYATTNLEAEGERIRETSMNTANAMSRAYGQSAEDTVGIIGDLAATGKTGMELQQAAQVVSRASMLGELDRQDAIKTTISLQTVFGQNTMQLAETFDYLNDLENSTSLSMRDMTVAIPKLSGVVQALGGDYKDMGLMMTAARSSGLEAAEAANMLKTVMFRAVSPYGKGAETFAAKTGTDLKALVASTNGEAIPTFLKMAEAIREAGLSQPDKTAVFKDVFGVYQGSKALQFIEELGQMGDKTTQTFAAAEVGMKSASELAEVAAQETARLQESASGRFKIALETIKTEMAEIGQPFLEVATTILGHLTKVISSFNNLGDTSKKIILWGAAFAAILGPVTMVTGVMVTLIGTFLKMTAMLASLGARYKAVSADQAAQTLLAKHGTLAFHSQAAAAQILSSQLNQINMALTTMAGKNAAAASAATRASGVMSAAAAAPVPVTPPSILQRARNRVSGVLGVGGAPATPSVVTAASATAISPIVPARQIDATTILAAQQAKVADATADIAENAGKAKREFSGVSTNALAAAGMVGLLAGGTSKWVNSISMALIALPAVIPVLKYIGSFSVFGKMAEQTKNFAKAVKPKITGVLGRLRAGLVAVSGIMGPLGIALAAAGVAFGFFYNKLRKAREESEALAGAGEGILVAVGGTPLVDGEYVKDENTNAQVEQFERNNEKSANALAKLGAQYKKTREEADKLAVRRRIQTIALEVFDATGDANKAKQAIDVALSAAGLTKLDVPINMSFNEDSVARVRAELSEMLVNSASENKGKWYDPGMSNDVQVQLQAEAKRLDQMYGQVQAGIINSDEYKKELDRVKNVFMQKGAEIAEGYVDQFTDVEKRIFRNNDVNPNNAAAVGNALMTNSKLVNQLKYNAPDGAGAKAAADINNVNRAYRFLSKTLADNMRINNSSEISAKDMGTFYKILGDSGKKAAGGIDQASDAAESADGTLDGVAQSAEDAAQAFNDMKDAYKEAMSSVSNAVFEAAGEQIESAHDATIERMEASSQSRLDSIEAESQRREREFEGRERAQENTHRNQDKTLEANQKRQTKVVEDSYDARVRAIENTMEAEEKAERVRQRMFEAEKARISRLAEMYNSNVDFNVALNSGDLDEAAKLSNNMRATQQQWAMDDAQIGQGDAAEQRRERQTAEIERINDAKEARMESLQDEQDRAKELLQDRQDREKRALDDEKRRYNDSVQSRRKAEEQKTRDAVNGENKRFAAAKKSLEMELATIRAFVPRNQAELNKHISNIEAAYGRHGFKLNTKSAEWSQFVSRAMTTATATATAQLQNNANWAKIGQDAGNQVAQGMLGMTFPQFLQWMRTGVVPNAPTTASGAPRAAAAPANPRQADRQSTQAVANRRAVQSRDRRLLQHGGGPAGQGSGRAGRPLTANLYSDEIPTILQRGEFVFQKQAVQKWGIPRLMEMNNGDIGPDHSGRMHNGGLVGGIGGIFQAAMQQGLEAGVFMGVKRKMQEGAEMPQKLSAFLSSGQQIAGVPAAARAGAGVTDLLFSLANGAVAAAPPGVDGFGPWLTAMQRQVRPDVLARVWRGLGMVPGRQYITSGLRPGATVAGTNRPSLHGSGRAVDIHALARRDGGSPADEAMGDKIAQVFRSGLIPGVSEVLWKTMQGGNHYNHVHVGFRHGGGPIGVPGLKIGGDIRYDNTIANLHKDEKVLTAPLSRSLERGIGNLDSAGGITYDITMDLRGAYIKEELDIERAVNKVFNANISKMGRKRIIT